MASYIPTTLFFGCLKSIYEQNTFSFIVCSPIASNFLARPEDETAEKSIYYCFKRWAYLDEYPQYLRPPPETTINFTNIHDWNVIKGKLYMEWRLVPTGVANRFVEVSTAKEDPPPAYSP
jgi:hypothetical protein